jgi:hypothetical protein
MMTILGPSEKYIGFERRYLKTEIITEYSIAEKFIDEYSIDFCQMTSGVYHRGAFLFNC